VPALAGDLFAFQLGIPFVDFNQTRFNVPYMYCGCPPPGKTASQKLFQLVNQYAKNMPPPFLRPLDQAGSLSATHPSDHNAIYFLHDNEASETSRQARIAEVEQRRQKRDTDKAKSRRSSSCDKNHHPAFLIPIPIFTETASCSAVSGNVVDLEPPTPVGKCRTGDEPKVPPTTTTSTNVRKSVHRSSHTTCASSGGKGGGGRRRPTRELRGGGPGFATLSSIAGTSGVGSDRPPVDSVHGGHDESHLGTEGGSPSGTSGGGAGSGSGGGSSGSGGVVSERDE
jgi:hypothetical protein